MRSKELAFHLQNVLDGVPWYGKSLMAILKSEGPYSKESLQLLQHMIAWRKLIIGKVNGEPQNIDIDSKEDWPDDPTFTIQAAREQLESTTKDLIKLIKDKDDMWYREKAPCLDYNYQFLIEGLIQHDIYHLGQIAMLLKGKKGEE